MSTSPAISSPRLFITGTDTNIGKTIVSSWLALHWRAQYWKPIQSGLTDELTDTQTVAQLSGAVCYPEAYRLTQPLSPHHAAAIDGVTIDLASVSIERHIPPQLTQPLIIEGAGGVYVPINSSHTMLDVMVQCAAPVLVVARSGLGTINHTCLTVMALRQRGLSVLGVVMVGALNAGNRVAIEQFADVPVLAELPILPEVTRAALQAIPLPSRLQQALTDIVAQSSAQPVSKCAV
jgi:dethiobiotin synthase